MGLQILLCVWHVTPLTPEDSSHSILIQLSYKVVQMRSVELIIWASAESGPQPNYRLDEVSMWHCWCEGLVHFLSVSFLTFSFPCGCFSRLCQFPRAQLLFCSIWRPAKKQKVLKVLTKQAFLFGWWGEPLAKQCSVTVYSQIIWLQTYFLPSSLSFMETSRLLWTLLCLILFKRLLFCGK